MSTLVAQTISNGTVSTSTANVVNGAKAWVNFNGTGTVAIRASYNVSSITDNGTGDYTINFTNAFTDADYSSVGSCSALSGGREGVVTFNSDTGGTIINPTTTAQRITTTRGNTSGDPTFVNIAVFR